MRAARRAAAAILAISALALTTGCVWKEPARTPERTPAAAEGPAALQPYYAQTLDWERCDGVEDGDYWCTDVTAPRDWDDPDAGDLSLALIMRLAPGESEAALLVNPGGPGASGYDLVADSTSFAVGTELAERFDVVGFDPRGVGRSTPVTCLDAPSMDVYLFQPTSAPRDTEAWEQELVARDEEFVAACEANSDGILPYISTVNAARDMDLLRAVLGDEKLNYLGYSYGAYLGAVYAELHPENVGRLVLDGGIDPSVPGSMVGARQAKGFESALHAFAAWCADARDCAFDGDTEGVVAGIADLLALVDAAPVAASDGRRVDAGALSMGIITALYNEGNWPFLSTALADLLAGDGTAVYRLVDMYYGRQAGSYADNSTEAFTAYNCMDYPAEDPADEAAAENYIAENAPTFAPYWSGVDTCVSWPYDPVGTRERVTAAGAEPIVLIGTTNDPATPYEWAAALAEQLESGVLVTREGEGHLGFNRGNRCVDQAVVDYFVDGVVPEDGLVCR